MLSERDSFLDGWIKHVDEPPEQVDVKNRS